MTNSSEDKLPPWKISDENQASMMWRMGGGEDYLTAWDAWFRQLGEGAQHVYIAKYPEPEDWFGFYRFRFLPPAGLEVLIEQYGDDPKKIPDDALTRLRQPQYDLLKQVETWRKRYCELHYELALLHEEAGHVEYAVEHMNRVKMLINNDSDLEDTYGKDVNERFVVMNDKLFQLRSLLPSKEL